MASVKSIIRKIIPVRASVFEKARKANDMRLDGIEAGIRKVDSSVNNLIGYIAGDAPSMASTGSATGDAVKPAISSGARESLDYAKLSVAVVSLSAQLTSIEEHLEALSERVERIERATCTEPEEVFKDLR